MQKLKNSIIDKMLSSHLSRAEVDFILYLSHYQDDKGKIYGVYYRDVCAALGISYETFYVTIDSLVAKGFLRCEKASYSDFDLTILGNDFSQPGAYQDGYLSTGHAIFFDKDFMALKAGAKLLALKILVITGATNSGKYYIAVEGFFEKYARCLQVTRRTIRTYLTKLRTFFSLTLSGKFYLFRPKSDKCFAEREQCILPSDQERFAEQLTRTACRRNRATYTDRDYKDTKALIRQYLAKLRTDMAKVFLAAVERSISQHNDSAANKYKWDRRLNPKFIHKLILQK